MDEVFVRKSTEDPKFVLDWLKGFKSDIGYWEPFVTDVSHGCDADVEVMGFANVAQQTDFLDNYREASYDRFFWDTPEQGQKDLPHVAGAHSMGAFLLLEHLMDDEKAKIFRNNYGALFLANPFLGDPYHDRILCRAFSKTLGRHKPTGSTKLERWLGPEITDFNENPTHMQSITLHDEAAKLLAAIQEKGGLSPVLDGMPIAIIAGENDPACDNEKIYALGEVIGVDVYTYLDTAHNPLLCHSDALDHFKSWAFNAAKYAHPKPPVYEAATYEAAREPV